MDDAVRAVLERVLREGAPRGHFIHPQRIDRGPRGERIATHTFPRDPEGCVTCAIEDTLAEAGRG